MAGRSLAVHAREIVVSSVEGGGAARGYEILYETYPLLCARRARGAKNRERRARGAHEAVAMAAASRWAHADAPNLWAVLDEATRVAERQLKVDAKEWWATMGHTAEVPLQVTSLRGMLNRHERLRNGTICEIG